MLFHIITNVYQHKVQQVRAQPSYCVDRPIVITSPPATELERQVSAGLTFLTSAKSRSCSSSPAPRPWVQSNPLRSPRCHWASVRRSLDSQRFGPRTTTTSYAPNLQTARRGIVSSRNHCQKRATTPLGTPWLRCLRTLRRLAVGALRFRWVVRGVPFIASGARRAPELQLALKSWQFELRGHAACQRNARRL